MANPYKTHAKAKAKAYQKAGGQSSYSPSSPLLDMLRGAHPLAMHPGYGSGPISFFGPQQGPDPFQSGGNDGEMADDFLLHPLYAAFGRAMMRRQQPQGFSPWGGQ